MRKESDIQKISELILKQMRQEITEEEKLFLANWLKQSNKNQELYVRIQNENYILEQYRLKQTIDTDKAWKHVTSFPRRRVSRYFGYAATILLLLGTYFIYRIESRTEIKPKDVVAMKPIQLSQKM